MTNRPDIYLALTDDWELRGDGSGDIDALQFKPMQRMLDIYDEYGVRSTFMAEVMQQLTFRSEQERHPTLRPLADAWDKHISDAVRRGHDVQLHVHPQWSDAKYDAEGWSLRGDWAMPNYTQEAAERMLTGAKGYLENLLGHAHPGYKCVAFRSGSSVIAPSPFMLSLLAKHGIVFDLSIVGGLKVNTRHVQYDYTNCDETLLPFFPDMTDARRLSDKAEPIVCVPIFHFFGSRRRVTMQNLSKVLVGAAKQQSSGGGDWTEAGRSSLVARVYDKLLRPALFRKHLTADIGRLTFPLLTEMLGAIRRRASETEHSAVPVILTNHSKDLKDFAVFERFVREISRADDIRTITLTELAEKLQAGDLPIKVSQETA